MPFAKRSTYSLTLAISTIIAAAYAQAETPSDQEMAWSCSMDKNGEWVCDVNEELVNQTESTPEPAPEVENTSPDVTAPSQTAPSSVEPAISEPVVVEPAAPAIAAPIPAVRNETQAQSQPIQPTTRSSQSQPVSRPNITAKPAVKSDAWNCVAGANGEWICNGEQSGVPSGAQEIVAPTVVPDVEPTGTANVATVPDTGIAPEAVSNVPYATDEVVGSEWQCTTTASGDWDCSKVNVYGTAIAGQPRSSKSGGAVQPAYIRDNQYAHLDWVYYQNPQGQQCSGRYLEPNFPINGDESLPNPPLYLEAGQSSTVLGGLTQLDGGVNMRQGSRRLSSDSAELDQVTNKARLEGDVSFREPGLLMLSDSAQVDTITSEAIFTNAQYVLHEDRLRGSADRIIRLEDNRLRLEQGEYTYCPPQSNAWGLNADSIVLNKEKGFGVAEDATLRVGGVPVLYAPYFTFPIDDTRRSGFLYPSIGYSQDNGLDVAVPYYFNIAPNIDDTLTARFMTDRGLLLENELRYLNSWSSNSLSTAYLADDDVTQDDRWLLGVDHTGRIGERWTTAIDFTRVSDNDYFDDLDTSLEVSRQDHLDQRADLAYNQENWQFRVRVHDYQTIDSSSETPYQKLPQLTFTGEQQLSDASLASLRADYTKFDRDIENLTGSDRIIGDRLHLRPTINYEWRTPGYYIKPELSLWSTSYTLDNQISGFDDNPSLTVPMASLDSGLIFERQRGNGGIQTLEPRFFALYVAEEDQDDIPDFDTSEYDFNYSALFRKNRFSGYDRIGDAQQVSLGLSTALYTEQGAETARFSIGQAYYFADRKVTLVSGAADETAGQTDIATEALWNITKNTRASLDMVLDNNNFDSKETNVRLRHKSDLNHRFDFSYRYEEDVRKQTDLSFIWPIAQHWTAMGRWLYDQMEKNSLETSLGLEYESCCWKVGFAGRRWLDDTNEYDTGIFLNFTLKGLGSFGSGSNGFLNDIIGYEEREEQNEN